MMTRRPYRLHSLSLIRSLLVKPGLRSVWILAGMLGLAAVSLATPAEASPYTIARTLPDPSIATVRRFALVVGANDGGHERVQLRYAGSDAKVVSGVMRELGGVAPGDLSRIGDPSPKGLMDALDAISQQIRAAKREGQQIQFFFYYSGHSDEEGLLLGGQRVNYKDLRVRVQKVPADVRIAILDSCASGAFTRLKGGTRRAPFLVGPAADVKGHAFLTSSSADEAAQESDRVGGSFFTHFLTTGLRGAADANGDRLITLSEAYQFAFDETLARTEVTRGGAQHAAYDIQLTGSGDLIMTDLRETTARLELESAVGGRVFVRTAGGDLAAELYKVPGGEPVLLALEPGRYQVTVDNGEALKRTELAVSHSSKAVLHVDALRVVEAEATVRRGEKPRATNKPKLEKVPFNIGLFPPLSINGQTTSRGRAVQNTFSLAFLWSRAARVDGLAASFGLTIVGEHVHGMQLSLIGNIAKGSVEGLQLGQIFNWAPRVTGVQAGLVNVTRQMEPGAQLGLVNRSRLLRGAQLGLINVGGQVNGAQVGLVNFAEQADASLGLIAITKEGNVHPEIFTSDTAAINVGLRLPARYTYTLLATGLHPAGDRAGWQFGLGFGGHIPAAKSKLFIDIDLLSSVVATGVRIDSNRSPGVLSKLRVMVGWQPFGRLALFGGPTLNVLGHEADVDVPRIGYGWSVIDRTVGATSETTDDSTTDESMTDDPMTDDSMTDSTSDTANPGIRLRAWPGFVAGLRF